MKKTILRVLAFLPAAVLLLAAAASACEHYPDEVSEAELIPSGYAEPGVGVPGYTGDLLCPVCGEVCIPGKTIPAKQPEAPHPASNDGETETLPKPQPKPEPRPEPDYAEEGAVPEPVAEPYIPAENRPASGETETRRRRRDKHEGQRRRLFSRVPPLIQSDEQEDGMLDGLPPMIDKNEAFHKPVYPK